jgi:hypothetical protein
MPKYFQFGISVQKYQHDMHLKYVLKRLRKPKITANFYIFVCRTVIYKNEN